MKLHKHIKENKVMVYSGVIAVIAVLLILLLVKQEVDRFVFIMPVFAGWILFNILMLPDDETEDVDSADIKEQKPKKKPRS